MVRNLRRGPNVTTRLTITPGPGSALLNHLPAAITKLVRAAVLEGEATAKIMAPIDTGYLRGSIAGEMVTDTAGELAAAAEYAPHVEFGTRHMNARPFMIPALEASRQYMDRHAKDLGT